MRKEIGIEGENRKQSTAAACATHQRGRRQLPRSVVRAAARWRKQSVAAIVIVKPVWHHRQRIIIEKNGVAKAA